MTSQVGRYCIVDDAATIAEDCILDDYTAVYGSASIGSRTRILYGAKVYDRARIGEDCIVGGDVAERAIIGDRVTYMGRMAHSHYDPSLDWDSTDEPSAVICDGSVVGDGAILIGGIRIGEGSYVGAGEILRHNLAPFSVYLKGEVHPIEHFRGLIKNRWSD
ncbi:hypothetical protein [Mycobacteroides abscessus]|uniref:hypothetical protein n=1 Tax=Mycobacteroides abscessus TaxID=36809 RepID=UPI0018779877|nr:hypothetical protein [Mycobacteroides abscessus]MDM2086008.1 hypothetical protein [Mycobacteroides abscessus]